MQSGPSFGHELASCAKHIPADGPVLSSDAPDELGHVIKKCGALNVLSCCRELHSSLLQALFLFASCFELGLKATTSHCGRRWLCWPGCMRQAMKEILLAGDTNRIWVRIPVNCFPSGYLPVTLGSVPNVCPFSPFEMRRRYSQKHLQVIISRRASPQTRVS